MNPHFHDGPQTSRSLLRRASSVLTWWILPSLVVSGVIGYFILAAVNHANPPLIAVAGRSMTPTIVTGELVVVRGVQPSDLKIGDVIAVIVPPADQEQYDLPPHVVHRIVKIEQTPVGLVFATKGDGNIGNDVFHTFSGSIVGQVVAHLPHLGYPILFLTSPQGAIFLGSVALVTLIYFVLGSLDARRAQRESTAHSVSDLVDEIASLKVLLNQLVDRAVVDPHRTRDTVAPILEDRENDAEGDSA